MHIALSEEHFLGWVEVASNVAGADVFLDRKEIGAIGRTPYTGHVKPGKHTIWLERVGYAPVRKEIEVALHAGTAAALLIGLRDEVGAAAREFERVAGIKAVRIS